MPILWMLTFVCCCLSDVYGLDLDLGSSATWTVKIQGEGNITAAATVPGGIYTDLANAGVLTQDIYYRFNDLAYRWVGLSDWTYTGVFSLSNQDLEHNIIKMDCFGIDTFAMVFINNKFVWNATNMFVRYTVNLRDHLVEGQNIVEFKFTSPVTYAREQFELQAKDYVVPPICIPDTFHGECHANHIRKMQASFSWDWGPAFPSMGIWQPIRLVSYDFNHPKIKYVKWHVEDGGDRWIVKLSVVMDAPAPVQCFMEFGVEDVIPQTTEEIFVEADDNGEAVWEHETEVDKTQVETWWPNGRGGQKLYNCKVVLRRYAGGIQSEQSIQVAFRTVELVQEPMTQGLSFYFKVNGEPIFMKGSNWIPAHVLPEQVTRDYIYDLLYSAKEAHMNMLRVWGGGIYELDDFYSIADELGILIWQDFMFACSMYQADGNTLANVEEETRHQVRRLQHHASVALWAGNNENEAALRGNWYETDDNFAQYKADYLKLYVETVKRIVEKEDPSRNFVVSSPSNGKESEEEGHLAMNPYSSLYGDTHYYDYRDNNWDWTIYPKTRFASEYGFQSFPSFGILEPVSETEDWAFPSVFMDHRQRHPHGNMELPWQINLNMYMNVSSLQTVEGYQQFLHLTQIYQAVSVKTSTETFRRAMTDVDPVTGEGMTMGALYWQLNDIWQGASWTSLEHRGNWRMSHYFAQQFFSDLLVSPYIDTNEGNVKVSAVCDYSNGGVEDTLHLEMKVHHWNSFTATNLISKDVEACGQPGAYIIYQESMDTLLEAGECHPGSYDSNRFNYCFFTFILSSAKTGLISTNYLIPPPKSATGKFGLKVANVDVTSVTRVNSILNLPYMESYTIHLHTDQVALFVWLEVGGVKGRFSENGFIMTEAEKEVMFLAKEFTSLDQIKEKLTVRVYTPCQGENLHCL